LQWLGKKEISAPLMQKNLVERMAQQKIADA
jgi:hypothetical protein